MVSALDSGSSGLGSIPGHQGGKRRVLVWYSWARHLTLTALQISRHDTESLLQDIDRIFSNISDIYEFSVTLLGLFEAAIEVADEGKQPAIGECFEEMAEVQYIVDSSQKLFC